VAAIRRIVGAAKELVEAERLLTRPARKPRRGKAVAHGDR
jgi:hypothetical protein